MEGGTAEAHERMGYENNSGREKAECEAKQLKQKQERQSEEKKGGQRKARHGGRRFRTCSWGAQREAKKEAQKSEKKREQQEKHLQQLQGKTQKLAPNLRTQK